MYRSSTSLAAGASSTMFRMSDIRSRAGPSSSLRARPWRPATYRFIARSMLTFSVLLRGHGRSGSPTGIASMAISSHGPNPQRGIRSAKHGRETGQANKQTLTTLKKYHSGIRLFTSWGLMVFCFAKGCIHPVSSVYSSVDKRNYHHEQGKDKVYPRKCLDSLDVLGYSHGIFYCGGGSLRGYDDSTDKPPTNHPNIGKQLSRPVFAQEAVKDINNGKHPQYKIDDEARRR